MEQAKQGGNETPPETAGYYRSVGCFSLKAAELDELLGRTLQAMKDKEALIEQRCAEG